MGRSHTYSMAIKNQERHLGHGNLPLLQGAKGPMPGSQPGIPAAGVLGIPLEGPAPRHTHSEL